MNVISMSLFTTQGRYWRTLLPTLISHIELYPGYQVHLHVARDAMAHPISGVLQALQDAMPNSFKYIEHAEPYQGHEPTLWRLLPLWQDGVETLFCRDIDSVPSTGELQASRMFISSEALIHSIRSFHLHTTLLMAGLCGFKVNRLQMIRDAIGSFDLFRNFYQNATTERKNFEWGCDQEALIMLCISLREIILDCPIGNCRPHHAASEIPTVDQDAMRGLPLYGLNPDLLTICDEITSIPWGEFVGFAGRPQGDFRSYLPRMLALDLPTCRVVKKVLADNPAVAEFYKPDLA